MCGTCGCAEADQTRDAGAAAAGGAHGSTHRLAPPRRVIDVEQAILARNDRLAAENRRWLAERGVRMVNLLSSPGSGKTTLLERAVEALRGELEVVVIEGDQATARDADRIRAAGGRAVQINTGRGCHLEAAAVGRALADLAPGPGALVVVENVGNLVCPALFDLGEGARVVVASVPEGDDKPLKYPFAFAGSDLVVLNKVDLAPFVPFSRERFDAYVDEVAPRASRLALSALRGHGMEGWYAWVRSAAAAAPAAGAAQ